MKAKIKLDVKCKSFKPAVNHRNLTLFKPISESKFESKILKPEAKKRISVKKQI